MARTYLQRAMRRHANPDPKRRKGARCYIACCARRDVQRIKRRLALSPGVYRITDHGSHLKINTTKPLPSIRGLRSVKVTDQTTHWDAAYWDFAMAAFRRSARLRQNPARAIGVTIHYLANLFGIADEAGFFFEQARSRIELDARITDEQAHGWEFQYVAKLKRNGAFHG
jgi:hypothetical protein